MKFNRLYPENVKSTINGVEYKWSGGFGEVISSKEKGVKKGELRIIGGIIFYAYKVKGLFRKKTISWTTQEEVSSEWLRDFKKAFCGVV